MNEQSRHSATCRWWQAREKKTGRIVYIRKGFGQDGNTLAVYDFLHHPHCALGRTTVQKAREDYVRLNVAPNTDEIEARFDWELNR